MLPVYLHIFDETLLFAQGGAEGSKPIPLYTVFTGQAALYFCLIEGDERRKSWYRIAHASGKAEDELFAMLNVTCQNGEVRVALAPGGGKLQPVGDPVVELARLYRAEDFRGVLGVDRSCGDPEVFERACETLKLVFQEEKDVHVLCDNAEHRLTAKHRPPPAPVQMPGQQASEPGPGHAWKAGAYKIMMPLAVMAVIVLALAGMLCVALVCALLSTGGWPTIEITPAISLLSRLPVTWPAGGGTW